MDNDAALDWVECHVERPLAAAIREAFDNSLQGPGTPAEVEAAAALLVEYTTPPVGEAKYRRIDLRREAAETGLWNLGMDSVRKLMGDAAWLDTWLSPPTKLHVLEELLNHLQELERQQDGLATS